MATSYHNNTRQIYAILAIALLWIFWPILSPTLLVLNYVAFLPFNIALTFIFTFGESILFTISLGCFGLFIKDTLTKKSEEVTNVEGPSDTEENMPNEDKIAGIKEKVSEAICEAEESCEIEGEPTESKIESFDPTSTPVLSSKSSLRNLSSGNISIITELFCIIIM